MSNTNPIQRRKRIVHDRPEVLGGEHLQDGRFEHVVRRALVDERGEFFASLTSRQLRSRFAEFGFDVFICAGYLLGHVHGIERNLKDRTPHLEEIFRKKPSVKDLLTRLERILHEHHPLIQESVWRSPRVVASGYCRLSFGGQKD